MKIRIPAFPTDIDVNLLCKCPFLHICFICALLQNELQSCISEYHVLISCDCSQGASLWSLMQIFLGIRDGIEG